MKNVIILAIVALILTVPLQMILPFPYGLLVAVAMWIIVVLLFLVKILRRPTSPTKSIPTQTKDNTQFWVCPNCGKDTQMKEGRQYCPSCKFYLSI